MTKFITSVAFLNKITNYLLEITRTILPKSSAAVNKFYIIEHSSVIHTTTKSHFVKYFCFFFFFINFKPVNEQESYVNIQILVIE